MPLFYFILFYFIFEESKVSDILNYRYYQYVNFAFDICLICFFFSLSLWSLDITMIYFIL